MKPCDVGFQTIQENSTKKEGGTCISITAHYDNRLIYIQNKNTAQPNIIIFITNTNTINKQPFDENVLACLLFIAHKHVSCCI